MMAMKPSEMNIEQSIRRKQIKPQAIIERYEIIDKKENEIDWSEYFN